MPNDEGFSFIGFMAVMVIAAVMIFGIKNGLADPDVIKGIYSISPYVAKHVKLLSWFAVGIIFLTAMILPAYYMFSGKDNLLKIGIAAWSIIITFSIMFLIPSIGFVFGVGWFSAQKYIGH